MITNHDFKVGDLVRLNQERHPGMGTMTIPHGTLCTIESLVGKNGIVVADYPGARHFTWFDKVDHPFHVGQEVWFTNQVSGKSLEGLPARVGERATVAELFAASDGFPAGVYLYKDYGWRWSINWLVDDPRKVDIRVGDRVEVIEARYVEQKLPLIGTVTELRSEGVHSLQDHGFLVATDGFGDMLARQVVLIERAKDVIVEDPQAKIDRLNGVIDATCAERDENRAEIRRLEDRLARSGDLTVTLQASRHRLRQALKAAERERDVALSRLREIERLCEQPIRAARACLIEDDLT